MNPFLQGIIIGFALAVPIGPIGILCIKRTLTLGYKGGLVVGFAGASADVLYSAVAISGVSLIIGFIDTQQFWLRLAGGAILIGAGFHLVRTASRGSDAASWERTSTRAFVSTMAFALTNPLTLFAFIAAFSAVGMSSVVHEITRGVILIAGVFTGSLSWFGLLTILAHLLRERLDRRGVGMINKIAGALLILFGVVVIVVALGSS